MSTLQANVNLTSTSTWGNLDAIIHAVAHCQRLATTANMPTLIRVHASIPLCDPWDYIDESCSQWAAWHDGSQGQCFTAIGAAMEWTSTNGSRFSDAESFCSQIQKLTIDTGSSHSTGPLPLLLGGFAFSELPNPNDPLWSSWPNAGLRVPELLIARQPNDTHCTVVIAATVHADTHPETLAQSLIERVETLHPKDASDAHATAGHWTATPIEERKDWTERVKQAQRAIENSDMTKIVMARSAQINAPKGMLFTPKSTLHTLRRQHPGAYCFGFGYGDACFLGASPETLVSVQGRGFKTHALAGTAPRGATAQQDNALGQGLLQSPKNREEQAVVTRMLESALSNVCSSIDIANEPVLLRLPQVQHLATPLSGTLRDGTSVFDVLNEIHPTPAVGGFPGKNAQEWLHANEPMDRGWYAGPVGWINRDGDGVFCVAIRSAFLTGTHATAFTGAGIVPDSDPDDEWVETEWKLSTAISGLTCTQESP